MHAMTIQDLRERGIRWHAIVAMASNRVIGRDGTLPWHFPEDLKLFKKRTMGCPIIMGRNTFLSLPKQRPLPGRNNVVVSRTMAPPKDATYTVIPSLEAYLDAVSGVGDAYLIGGAHLFEAGLALCETLVLTFVHETYEGDVLMPAFEGQFTFEENEASFDAFEVRRYVRSEQNGKVAIPN